VTGTFCNPCLRAGPFEIWWPGTELNRRRQPFQAKINSDYNNFVARVALEVVDGSWCKQQLRVKSADNRTTALPSNEGGIAAAVIRLRAVSVPTFFRSSRFSLGGVSTRSKLPGSPEDARNRLELQSCGLEFHPEKTKIVYCKDDSRKKTYSTETFDFLGYAFRPRSSMTRKGRFFLNFRPAVSNKAAKAIRDTFRSWKLPQRSDKAIDDLSRMFNPMIRGWIQYYGRYYHSALYPTMRELNRDLALWAKRKYKKLRSHLRKAKHWIACISRRAPALFAHWQMGARRGSMMGVV
jgi:group II intron maturase